MIRFLTISAIASILSAGAFAADNGGFGESFTSKTPTALLEAPDSQIAQSVQTPSAEDLQNIMPAAGDETQDLLNAVPTTTHDSGETAIPADK